MSKYVSQIAENAQPGSLQDALTALAAELSALGWTSRARTLPGRPAGVTIRVLRPAGTS
jgi:hypothetical protein